MCTLHFIQTFTELYRIVLKKSVYNPYPKKLSSNVFSMHTHIHTAKFIKADLQFLHNIKWTIKSYLFE